MRTIYLAQAPSGFYLRSDGSQTSQPMDAEWFDTPKAITDWYEGDELKLRAIPFEIAPKAS